VGFVWQQSARNLVPYLNALDNVTLPMTLSGLSVRNKKQQASYLLEMVGLGDRIHHHLPELSGGEQQRVAIAVALANEPTLLLADEPTGEVDSATAKVIYETFQTLTREIGLTTVIVSHDPGVARQVDRVVAIRDGMLASETVRQNLNVEMGEGEGSVEDDENYAELIVVDSSGRLHIPPDYLEQFEFDGRAQIDATEEGLLIRPYGAPPITATQPKAEPKQGLWSNLIRSAAQKRTEGRTEEKAVAEVAKPVAPQPAPEPQPISEPRPIDLPVESPADPPTEQPPTMPEIPADTEAPQAPPPTVPAQKTRRGLKGRAKRRPVQNYPDPNYPDPNYPPPAYPPPAYPPPNNPPSSNYPDPNYPPEDSDNS